MSKKKDLCNSYASVDQLKIWRVEEVADFLGLAVKTIYNKVNKGEIPNYKRGKFLYFVPAEIITWLMVGGRR